MDPNRTSISLPVLTVKKIYLTPPSSGISDAFFKLCVVAACTKRDVLMSYKHTYFQHNTMLDEYVNTYYAQQGKVNFNTLNFIGNLLLCHVPNSFCDYISTYRQKLKANSIFESDLQNSELSNLQKNILGEKLANLNKENAKLCGYIMYCFMVKCKHGEPLPNVDFLTDTTIKLTDGAQKDLFTPIISLYMD